MSSFLSNQIFSGYYCIYVVLTWPPLRPPPPLPTASVLLHIQYTCAIFVYIWAFFLYNKKKKIKKTLHNQVHVWNYIYLIVLKFNLLTVCCIYCVPDDWVKGRCLHLPSVFPYCPVPLYVRYVQNAAWYVHNYNLTYAGMGVRSWFGVPAFFYLVFMM